jgi:F0F1-type ATP synthase epsilon subunit
MAEASSFKLKVIGPGGLDVDVDVTEVLVPSVTGEIGFLPQHIRYIGLVGIGVLSYWLADGSGPQRLVIDRGLCSFVDETLTVLANDLYEPAEADLEHYRKQKQELTDFLQGGHYDDPDRVLARDQLACIEAIEKSA